MIDGIKIKNLKSIRDDRGWLMEILRSDEPVFKKFGQVYITSCKQNVAKAWHYHKKQTDTFVCVFGKALVVLFDIRKDSQTEGKVEEYILSDPSHEENLILLQIPPMVVHGFTALDCEEVRIVNVPDLPYNRDNPDEFRMPWDGKEVPYKWPENVKRGG